MEIVPFEERHLAGVVTLCRAEGWPSFGNDPALAQRALTAPGVATVVAIADGEVVGFAEGQGDGVLQGHLSLIAVRSNQRRKGIARALIAELFRRMGVHRMDLITESNEAAFYEALPHREMRGFRIYPERGSGES